MQRKVVEHGIYRHFKGKYYIVEGFAKHSETGEQMVVYRHLYGDKSLCVRPVDMFLSKVDREKYPDAKQEYRFEEVMEVTDARPVGRCDFKDSTMFDELCRLYKVDRDTPDVQDALMSAVWMSSQFRQGGK